MVAKRTGLGRGLEALLGPSVPVPTASFDTVTATPSSEGPQTLPVDLLVRGTYQPRHDMHLESLEDLAQSIRAQGVIQPIIVRPLPERDSSGAPRYEIVAGERRWRDCSPSRW
jgi:ParB family chromosome partitioning protein